MRQRGPATVLALAAMLYAFFVATAYLPDQTWMYGVYDGADDDNVLLLVWEASGTPQLRPSLPAPSFLFPMEHDGPPRSAPITSVAPLSRSPPFVRFTA